MSLLSNLVHQIMKIINYRAIIVRQFRKELARGNAPDKKAKSFPTARVVKNSNTSAHTVLGSNVFTISPKSIPNNKVILYFHGGAYIRGAVKQHWDFVCSLVSGYGYTVVFPDYPLAPQYSYKEVFERVEIIYRDLTEKYSQEQIILMGDSAGGGIALALAQKLRINASVQPAHIVLLSPWLDISMTNPDIPAIQKKDPFLSAKGLKAAGLSYAKEISVKNQLVSPIYGEFHGLGKLSVFTGTYDILYADAIRLKNLCEEQKIEINFFEYQKMLHVWMILGFPESRQAISQIDEIIRV